MESNNPKRSVLREDKKVRHVQTSQGSFIAGLQRKGERGDRWGKGYRRFLDGTKTRRFEGWKMKSF